MKKFDELNVCNSTIFDYVGVELRTVDDPYIADDGVNVFYKALAVDTHNRLYEIQWDIIANDFEQLQDESEACNWEEPTKVIPLYTT